MVFLVGVLVAETEAAGVPESVADFVDVVVFELVVGEAELLDSQAISVQTISNLSVQEQVLQPSVAEKL